MSIEVGMLLLLRRLFQVELLSLPARDYTTGKLQHVPTIWVLKVNHVNRMLVVADPVIVYENTAARVSAIPTQGRSGDPLDRHL
jgi:hypothetical protein